MKPDQLSCCCFFYYYYYYYCCCRHLVASATSLPGIISLSRCVLPRGLFCFADRTKFVGSSERAGVLVCDGRGSRVCGVCGLESEVVELMRGDRLEMLLARLLLFCSH